AGPSAINGLSVAPAAASAAWAASPINSPASRPAFRSKIASPIATPPRGGPPEGLKTPNGKFWIGNSAWPRAEVTQLSRLGSWVSSITLIARHPVGEPDPRQSSSMLAALSGSLRDSPARRAAGGDAPHQRPCLAGRDPCPYDRALAAVGIPPCETISRSPRSSPSSPCSASGERRRRRRRKRVRCWLYSANALSRPAAGRTL